jgi:hypothetical protein
MRTLRKIIWFIGVETQTVLQRENKTIWRKQIVLLCEAVKFCTVPLTSDRMFCRNTQQQSFIFAYNVHINFQIYIYIYIKNVCIDDVHIVMYTTFNKAQSATHVTFWQTEFITFSRRYIYCNINVFVSNKICIYFSIHEDELHTCTLPCSNLFMLINREINDVV